MNDTEIVGYNVKTIVHNVQSSSVAKMNPTLAKVKIPLISWDSKNLLVSF